MRCTALWITLWATIGLPHVLDVHALPVAASGALTAEHR
jgi:hypothetical protein